MTERLKDKNDHFPYKHKAIKELIVENPPAGPNGPDDDSRRITDYTSDEIANASNDYVTAQSEYLKNPTRSNLVVYKARKQELIRARLAHRRDRG